MDIRCERCQTEYEFDEARLPEAGLPVKCTTCGHVFKVRRGMGTPSSGPVQLRRGNQVIAVAPDAATVAQWIAERRLLADDEFSAANAPFRRLGEAPEFARLFAPPTPAPAPAPVTQQMVAPGLAGAPTRPSAFQVPPAPQTAQFHVGAIPPAEQGDAATMQFRVPADLQGTPAYGSAPVAAPVAPPPPGSTMQFRVPASVAAAAQAADAGVPPQTAQFHMGAIPTATPIAAEQARTAQFHVGSIPTASPAPNPAPPPQTAQFSVGSIPTAAPAASAQGPAKTAQFHVGTTVPDARPEPLQFRVPISSAAKPSDAITNVMSVPGPSDPDTQATAQFKLPGPSRLTEALAAADDSTAPTLQGMPVLRMPQPAPSPAPAPVAAPAPITEPARPFEPAKTEAFRLADLPAPEPVRPQPPPPRAEPVREEPPLAKTEPAPVRRQSDSEPEWSRPAQRRAAVQEEDSSADDADDPAILEFQQAGRRNRLVGAVVAAVAVVGALGWFVVLPLVTGGAKPSEEALAALSEGREAYLAGTLARFSDAEAAYGKALALAGKAKFPQAHAALAELRCAWAEVLMDDYARVTQQAKDHAAANAPDAAELAKKANGEAEEIQKQLKAAFDESKVAFDLDPVGLAGNRALVDYFRVAGDPKQVAQHLKPVEKAAATDNESKAHLAAAWALEPGKLPAAEAALVDVTKAEPKFVRAGFWLAAVREKKGDLAGAAEAMKALLARAPGHEGAKRWLDARAHAEEPKKAAEPKPEAEPAKAEEKGETKAADAKPEPKAEPKVAEKAPEKVTEKPLEKPAAAIDTDKLISQANKLLEKNKSDKALALCEQVLAAKPNNLDALYDKGVALFNLERIDDAIATFKQALGVSPNFSDAMVVLADAYKTKGQTKEALQWYRKYLEVMPNGEDAAAARANIQKLGGK